MTDERDTPASKPPGKRRSRKRPESAVDRGRLAAAVSARVAELALEGVKQEDAAKLAGCGVSTLRHMQNGTGTSHYSYETLTRVATGLGLPEDRLVKAFHRSVPRDPALASGAGLAVQPMIDQLTPYLAKLDAIPEMRADISGMQKVVAGLQERLKGMAHDVHEVRSRLDSIADVFHQPPAG